MTPAERERFAYHALSRTFEGSLTRLAATRRAHKSWSEAHQDILHKTPEPDPRLPAEGIRLILAEDEAFPSLLREMPRPPLALYIKGSLPPSEPQVAIVGTRKATEEGRALAGEFAERLAQKDITIVSGLAFGIDAAAHFGALSAHGRTIAVLGCGVDKPYPAAHAALAKRIIAGGGALVSEYPPGTPPLPYRFLERNRVVAGLCMGTVVIEAPIRSGSLVTARLAAEAGRSVFVVPGSIRHSNFVGAHALIRDGAELVTGPEDVLVSLGFDAATPKTISGKPTDPRGVKILAVLQSQADPVSIDTIIDRTGLPTAEALEALTLLMLEDRIAETTTGYTTI